MRSSWLQTHLEGFVKPHLGFVPSLNGMRTRFFTPEEMVVLKNVWRAVKRASNHSTILLPGRDVWVFEVLARREGYPTIFRPDISRATVRLIAQKEPHLKNYFLFDTGFMGSIPMKLGTPEDKFWLLSGKNQKFPSLKGARSLALKVEATRKYWESAVTDYDSTRVEQQLSQKSEFLSAALLTIEIYTDCSPRFIHKRLDLNSMKGV